MLKRAEALGSGASPEQDGLRRPLSPSRPLLLLKEIMDVLLPWGFWKVHMIQFMRSDLLNYRL